MEGDAVVVGLDQAIVGDRDPVGVAAEIGERGGRPVERFFTVDEPFGLLERGEIGGECSLVAEPLMVAEEAKLVLMMGGLKLFQHQTAKKHGEHPNR